MQSFCKIKKFAKIRLNVFFLQPLRAMGTIGEREKSNPLKKLHYFINIIDNPVFLLIIIIIFNTLLIIAVRYCKYYTNYKKSFKQNCI